MSVLENPVQATKPVSVRSVRTTGIALAASTASWAAGIALVSTHQGFGWQSLVGGATAIAFQLSLVRLLLLQVRTGAMGTGRIAKSFYIAQFVFMAGALVSSLLDAFWLIRQTPVWMVFAAFWPLSMFGMVGIGVRIAIAGRWTGIVRWWTLWAQSWFVATIPLVIVVKQAGEFMGSAHLIAGYVALGIILATSGTVTPK